MKKNALCFAVILILLISLTGCPMSQDIIEYQLNLSLSSDESGVHLNMVDPISKGVSHELTGALKNAYIIWVKRRVAQSNDSWEYVGNVQRSRPNHLYDTDCKFDDYFVEEGVTYEYCLKVSLYDNETQQSSTINSMCSEITAKGGYGEARFDSTVTYTYNSETSLLKLNLNPEIQVNCPPGVISPYNIGIWNGDKRYDWNHTLTPSELENGIYLNSDDLHIPNLGYTNNNPLLNTPVNIDLWMEFTRFDDTHLITTWQCLGTLSGDIVSTWNSETPPVSIVITK